MRGKIISKILVCSLFAAVTLTGCRDKDETQAVKESESKQETSGEASAQDDNDETESDNKADVQENIFADKTVFDDEVFDYYASLDWQRAFKKILDMKNADSNADSDTYTRTYAIYDIDKDDTPELLIKEGTCEADYLTTVYIAKGDTAVEAGTINGGHTLYYTDPNGNGVIESMGHMGYGFIGRDALVNGKMVDCDIIFEDDLYERSKIDPDAEYTEVNTIVEGAEPIDMYFTSYFYGIIEYNSPVIFTGNDNLSKEDFEGKIKNILDCSENFWAVNANPVFISEAKLFGKDTNLIDLYSQDGLFRYSEGEPYVRNTYYDDFNGDGSMECLVEFGDSVYDNTSLILFSYQNSTMYGYIVRDLSGKDIVARNGRIYHCNEYEYGNEIIIKYCLDECVVDRAKSDEVAFSDRALVSLKKLRKELTSEGALAGVAYLGYSGIDELKTMSNIIFEAGEDYPGLAFMSELGKCSRIKLPGGEVYVIVPADENQVITVYEQVWGENSVDGMPQRGNMIYKSKPGEIITIKGNQSDIVPNIELSMTSDGNEYVYYPSLSLENGQLTSDNKIKDISFYPEDPEW